MNSFFGIKKFKKAIWHFIPNRFHLKLKLIYMLVTGNYDKEMVYFRDKNIVDGGSVYWNRNIIEPDISPIVEAL